MGKRFEEVKDLNFGCKMFEFQDIDDVIKYMNDFISFPRENDLDYRIMPIDISLATKVIPITAGKYGEDSIISSRVSHSLMMIYEKVFATQ